MAPRLCIGCSGWNYKSWRSRFYPAGLAATEWLAHYLTRFDTVETNATFYRLPSRDTFAGWREQTPDSFVMAIKASRYLTHLKRLLQPEEPVARLFEHAAGLGSRLGPVLYQLPASLECDLPRLERVLAVLPERVPLEGGATHPVQHTFEFRHPSWYVDETYRLLTDHGAALCLHDMAGSAVDVPEIGPFTYVRFHGAVGKYFGSYGDDVLGGWARRLAAEWQRGREVYAYFNNDPDAVSTGDALRLREMTFAAAGTREVGAAMTGQPTSEEMDDDAPAGRRVRSH